MPMSRGSELMVTADEFADVQAAAYGGAAKSKSANKKKGEQTNIKFDDGGEPYSTSYKSHYPIIPGKARTSKKRDAAIDFGANRYMATSYGSHFTEKKCLVPTLAQLDQYTFKEVAKGHQVYEINCGCPPKGNCGCTPPPTPAVAV
eukprot:sb/3473857/